MHYMGVLFPRHILDRVYRSNICTQRHTEHLRHPARPSTLPQSVQLSQTLFCVISVWSGQVSLVSQDILKETRNLWFSAGSTPCMFRCLSIVQYLESLLNSLQLVLDGLELPEHGGESWTVLCEEVKGSVNIHQSTIVSKMQ